MTEDELKAIRERLEAASPGPWTADEVDLEGRRMVRKFEDRNPIQVVCRVGPTDNDRKWHKLDDRPLLNRDANADFIALAREDVAALLAYIETLERILADCQQDSLAYLAGVQDGLAVGKRPG